MQHKLHIHICIYCLDMQHKLHIHTYICRATYWQLTVTIPLSLASLTLQLVWGVMMGHPKCTFCLMLTVCIALKINIKVACTYTVHTLYIHCTYIVLLIYILYYNIYINQVYRDSVHCTHGAYIVLQIRIFRSIILYILSCTY